MISGNVNSQLEARVRISVRGSSDETAEIEFVVDTGFTGAITLPKSSVESLRLPVFRWRKVILADNSVVNTLVYEGMVTWNNEAHSVLVHCIEGPPLLGMRFLLNHRLTLDAVVGGPVTIAKLQ